MDKFSVMIVIFFIVVLNKVNVSCFRNRMLILIIGFKVFLVLVLILEFVIGYCCNLVVCRFKIMDLDDYLLFLYYIFVFLYYIFLYSLCI